MQINPINHPSRNDIINKIQILLANNLEIEINPQLSHEESELLGKVTSLDSMSIVNILGDLEDEFGITIYDDDDLDADIFTTISSLTDFVISKIATT